LVEEKAEILKKVHEWQMKETGETLDMEDLDRLLVGLGERVKRLWPSGYAAFLTDLGIYGLGVHYRERV